MSILIGMAAVLAMSRSPPLFFWTPSARADGGAVTSGAAVSAQASATPSRVAEVARSPAWRRLLHVEKGFLGIGLRSRAATDSFFVAPGRGRDPEAELAAELELFRTGIPFASHGTTGPLRCFFPSRFEFLKTEGLLAPSIAVPDCPALTEWKARFKPKYLTMVYASAFMGNPASAFGHTFLRVDSESPVAGAVRSRLLDTGLSYGADSRGEGGPAFLVKGLIGGYFGRWSMLPYYEKTLEYNDVEARDLWEYRLSLTPEEIDRFLNHLWEVTGGDFAYYFLDENCSHINLAILEAVKPEWDLLSAFHGYVIPIDTVRALTAIPGAVTTVKHSPNIRQELSRRLAVLTSEERGRLLAWRESSDLALDGSETAPLLDAWITERKLKSIREKRAELPAAEDELRHRVLVARSKTPEDPRTAESRAPALEATPPDQGHRNGKLWTGAELGGANGWVIGHRFAYHDLLDADAGHLAFSEIEVLGTEIALRWDTPSKGDARFQINRFRILRSTSLNPVDLTGSPWSWHLSLGGERIPLWDGRTPMVADLAFALGKSLYLDLLSRRALVFAMAKLGLQANGVFTHGLRGGPGLWAGIVSSPTPKLKWGVNAEALWNPWQRLASGGRAVWRMGLGVSGQVARDWELRGESKIEAGFKAAADFGWMSTIAVARYY